MITGKDLFELVDNHLAYLKDVGFNFLISDSSRIHITNDVKSFNYDHIKDDLLPFLELLDQHNEISYIVFRSKHRLKKVYLTIDKVLNDEIYNESPFDIDLYHLDLIIVAIDRKHENIIKTLINKN